MSEEYAKVNSMIDDPVSDEDIIKKLPKSKGSLAGRVFRGAADKAGSAAATVAGGVGNMGMRVIAGGMAAVQTASITSIATVASVILGLGIAADTGDGFSIQYRDESFPDNEYNCLDEYAEAWKGVFGTINESPLAQQTGVVIKRLREINEWSKAYVGQNVPDALVCQTEGCPYYGHTGCDNPDHTVKQQEEGIKGYYDFGGKIDLANVMRIHDFFAEYGLTDVQIAAICGVATIESRIDFTSLEGYNLSGDRYNLDPSVKTDEYGFKPWAEGIDSPIQTPTCMHEIIANTYDGPDQPIDYAAYSAEYPSIHKLGIGLVGFTDGPGFYNNTFLRNYADELNDKVTLIQRLVEGSRGWREELRQRAADIYHVIFGADGDDKRGNANDYIEKVDENTFLFFKDHPEYLQELDNWDERTVDGELKSSAWLYEDAYNKYQEAERALVAAVNDYQATADEYEAKLNQLKNGPWMYHTVSTSNDVGGGVLEDVTFEKHSLPDENGNGGDIDKITTNNNEDSRYLSILKLHKLYECGPSEQFEPFVEYENTYTGESKNNIDVIYAEANPVWQEDPKNPNMTQSISITCQHGTGPGNPYNPALGGSGIMPQPPIPPGPYDPPWAWSAYEAQYNAYLNQLAQWERDRQYRQEQIDAEAAQIAAGQMPTAPVPPSLPNIPRPGSYPRREDYGYSPYYGWLYGNEAAYQQALNEYTAAAAVWSQYDQAMRIYNIKLSQYQQDMAYMNANGGLDFFTGTNPAAEAEHARIFALKAELDALAPQVKQKFDFMQQKKAEYDETLEDFNKWSKAFAHDIVRFYNALQDFYTASEFDMETRIRDAAYTNTSIFDETPFYTKAAYEYKFNELISGESVDFRALFGELGTGDEEESDDDENPKPTPQRLKLYYELWQNYAKYATNLPQNGKYINWWVPEVQLLYFVGGSYDAEKDQGLKIRDEYKNQSCGECSSGLPERDTTGKYYYDWMSSWKGEDYTGRDITTATKNFFYDMVSGGFDDGTLTLRTEYAYAYYYMFQYGSPYQQAINYAGAGGEASRIMEEMIAEGRWQTNTSNTLSDTAMPHNDKWKEFQTAEITRQWEIDTSTSMSTSILSILGSNQNHSRVNLLTDIWNGCKYINVIENSTVANSAMYLVDNPLIYKKDDEFYKMKYADYDAVENQPVSNLYKVVFNTINERLKNKGKSAMSGEPSDGFNFVKTCVLWSGMDAEFENINSIEDLHEYLKEATSSVWQDESEYQTDEDNEKAIGRGNSRIWEQRKLGPYYDENGNVYYRYKWYLVPRVLGERNVDTDLKWYDDMCNDDAERGFGEPDEDLDKWDIHNVDEHDTNNTPSIAKGEDVDGYKRKLNENKRTADWMRIDWECWDKQCEICGGKGGHGDTNLLCAGDLLVSDDKVCIWLGEDKVQSMFPLEKNSDEKLVYAGGDEATRLKSMDDETGFEWSKPCADYINHDTPCPTHGSLNDLPKEAQKEDPASCNPYNPEGKWTVYRLITSNYTDEYRNAGIVFDITRDGEWQLWYEYKYKGMAPKSDTKYYLEEIRKEIDAVINTDYPRDR